MHHSRILPPHNLDSDKTHTDWEKVLLLKSFFRILFSLALILSEVILQSYDNVTMTLYMFSVNTK